MFEYEYKTRLQFISYRLIDVETSIFNCSSFFHQYLVLFHYESKVSARSLALIVKDLSEVNWNLALNRRDIAEVNIFVYKAVSSNIM